MSEVIIKAGQHYYMWDVATDKPTTCGLTREGVRAYFNEKEGPEVLQSVAGEHAFLARLDRADAIGSSSSHHTDKHIRKIVAAIRSQFLLDDPKPEKPATNAVATTAQAIQRPEA